MVFTSPWGQLKHVPTGNALETMNQSPYHCDAGTPAYINATTGDQITFGELSKANGRLATVFNEKLGLSRNDVLCLFAFNSIYTHTIHMSTLMVGATVSPANIMYTGEELAHQIGFTQSKVIIYSDAQLPVVKRAMEIAKVSPQLYTMTEISKMIKECIANDSIPSFKPVELDGKSAHAYYCFSSGTSGLPKGVMTTHQNIISNVLQCDHIDMEMYRSGNIQGNVLPLSHIYALEFIVWLMPYRRITTVLFERFDFEQYLSSTVKYKISSHLLVPPIILLLAKSPLMAKHPDVQKYMKYVNSAAAPISESTLQLAMKQLPNTKFTQAYGLTETSPLAIVSGLNNNKDYRSETNGWLAPSVEARLVDPENGDDINEFGKSGELWLRGPNVFIGYLKNQKATDESITSDKWFKTGDVAVVDESGQWMIVDRIKELIKSKGHQVAPAELEALLLDHPKVQDTAVVGVADEDGVTELPRAYVVLQPGASKHEVATWFNKRVAKHKRLWGGIVAIDVIPKSPSGKILRRLLRERAKTEKSEFMELAKL